MFIVNGKSHCCDLLLLTSCLQYRKQTIFSKNTSYFYAAWISILLAILSEIFIQINYFSGSYARKQKWVFFLNTVYRMEEV